VRLALARRGLSAPFHDLVDPPPERHPLGAWRIHVGFVDAALLGMVAGSPRWKVSTVLMRPPSCPNCATLLPDRWAAVRPRAVRWVLLSRDAGTSRGFEQTPVRPASVRS
jgi:hypothetical protein